MHWQPYIAHGAAGSLMRQVVALDHRDTLTIADELPRLRLPAGGRVGGHPAEIADAVNDLLG